ncbi:MAG: FtsK/SpoIIIE domain-containing protein, partial [Chloroflexota bacterium]
IVYVRVPRPSGESDDTLTFQQAWALAPSIPVGSVLLGVDDDHSQLVLELDSPTSAHVAVIGMTGSGKSTLMRTMILSAQMVGGARLALFDPSNGFWPLSGHPSVWRGGLFRDAEACELGLEALASSLGRTQYGLLYVFIDEVPDLVMQRPRVRDHLARLAQSGRHAGIHLILGAQHPLASEFGSLTMRNVPVRLVGKVADRTAAYHATGRSDTDASSLRGRGDFAAVNGGNIRHFQAAYLSPEALEAWAQRYPPRPPRLPVRMCALVGPGGDDDELMREGGNGGRPRDDIPPQIVDQIRAYIAENGRPPSSNWVYRLSRSVLPSGGFNREKARRALEAASAHLAQAQAPTS